MKKSIRYFKLLSASPTGLRSPLVTVEAVITPGIPRHHVVGLAQGAVKESLVRIRAAMLRAGYDFPRGAITVNLAPADTRKDSSAFDLPIALGILAADRRIDASCLESAPTLVLGELSLEGGVRPVSGVMPAMMRAKESGLKRFLIPSENAPEASAFEGLQGACVSSLKEAVDQLKTPAWSSVKMTRFNIEPPPEKDSPPDFSVVIG